MNFSGISDQTTNENCHSRENAEINSNVSPALKPKTAYEKFLSTVYKIVKVSFISVSSVVLFVINPAFFMAGLVPSFIACVIFPEKINKVLERVSTVWKVLFIPIVLAAGLGFIAGWPVVIAGASCLAGAYISMKVVAYCCKKDL